MHIYKNLSWGLQGLKKVAILGNDLPRQCGIATFTSHLAQGLIDQNPGTQFDVIAMSDRDGYDYPSRVKYQISAQREDAYPRAAEFINEGYYDVLLVQHEYGIFGGESGDYLLGLLQQVKIPIVTTLHTVLQNPSAHQKAVLLSVLQLSQRVVVMSVLAIKIIEELYLIPREKIDLIPHGIPEINLTSPSQIKKRHGIGGLMVFTFGLLSPDKGIQYAIRAMPKILDTDPDAAYVVLGATHPHVKATAGEAYRNTLISLAEELGISDRIIFVDRFVSEGELVEYLHASDVYITPYLNPAQITSGTLAYALGAGKSVISTPYLYAQELLAEGRGSLVPFRDEDAISNAVLDLKASNIASRKVEKNTAEYCRPLQWSTVSNRYYETLVLARRESVAELSALNPRQYFTPEPGFRFSKNGAPTIKTLHLENMSDQTGLFQHAIYTAPDLAHGYCVDDNARALMLTAYLEAEAPLSPTIKNLQTTYLEFVASSFNEANGRFRNFMSSAAKWLEDQGSTDSHARTLWSLGALARYSKTTDHRLSAIRLFWNGIPAVASMQSPRTWAFTVLGLDDYLSACPGDADAEMLLREYSERLWREYRSCSRPDWPWFEVIATYDNARLSQALCLAGVRLGIHEMVEDGLRSLRWLMENQVTESGIFEPVGSNGFWPQDGLKARFDQQPVEAWSAISACNTAFRISSDSVWVSFADRAFAWFEGSNSLGLPVCDPKTGGCRDGIHPRRLNQNQGAESTLSYLCALVERQAARYPITPVAGWSLI